MSLINMENIKHVQQRIAAIQDKLGITGAVPGADFQETLKNQISNTTPVTAVEKTDAVKKTDKAEVNLSDTNVSNVSEAINADKVAMETAGTWSAGDFEKLVNDAAAKYQVDPKLVAAVAEAESGKDQSAISPAGAVGVMQLMPSTAAALGVDPYDKQQNIEGGAKYLRQMLDSFGGDVQKAVAAYNAGAQAVRDYDGVPPYSETQNYVRRVLDMYR